MAILFPRKVSIGNLIPAVYKSPFSTFQLCCILRSFFWDQNHVDFCEIRHVRLADALEACTVKIWNVFWVNVIIIQCRAIVVVCAMWIFLRSYKYFHNN